MTGLENIVFGILILAVVVVIIVFSIVNKKRNKAKEEKDLENFIISEYTGVYNKVSKSLPVIVNFLKSTIEKLKVNPGAIENREDSSDAICKYLIWKNVSEIIDFTSGEPNEFKTFVESIENEIPQVSMKSLEFYVSYNNEKRDSEEDYKKYPDISDLRNKWENELSPIIDDIFSKYVPNIDNVLANNSSFSKEANKIKLKILHTQKLRDREDEIEDYEREKEVARAETQKAQTRAIYDSQISALESQREEAYRKGDTVKRDALDRQINNLKSKR